jgi:hypothetical protein
MTLAFDAKFVDCADAIEGEILQVTFDTVPANQDENKRITPYVLISRNFEFPDSPTIEWHDGHHDDGGAEIIAMTLRRDRASIVLDRDLQIDLTFRLPDEQFAKLTSLLKRMIDDRVTFPRY